MGDVTCGIAVPDLVRSAPLSSLLSRWHRRGDRLWKMIVVLSRSDKLTVGVFTVRNGEASRYEINTF